MELKVASIQDIQNELKRREMLEKDKRIKDFFIEITVAYNTGKISGIYRDDDDDDTGRKYHVFIK